MIIPVGQEESTVRRHPWVTYVLMALCLAAFLVTHPPNVEIRERAVRQLGEAFDYYLEHPYLELSEEHRRLFFGVSAGEEGGVPPAIGIFEDFIARPEPEAIEAEQKRLEEMIAGALSAIDEMPARRFGLIPSSRTFGGALAHMFLHGGWMHLLGNMFLLFICGPFLEDVWGRPLYGAFYLAAGLFSGLAFSLHFPASELPLIGASGAIAGVMGAFAVRHWSRRMRFLYFFWLFISVRYGTFSAPAWLMLPLWFFGELLSAALTNDLFAMGAGGVAYWAHVWGFVFGAGAAVLVGKLNFEKKFVESALEKKETIYENPEVEEADRALEEGRVDEAWGILNKRVSRSPGDIDAGLALWSLALRVDRAAEAAPAMLGAIAGEVRGNDCGTAFLHWQELKQHVPEAALPAETGARMILGLQKEDLAEEAREVAPVVAGAMTPDLAPGILVRLAALPHSPLRERAAAIALEHPEVPATAKDRLRDLASPSAAPAPAPERPGRLRARQASPPPLDRPPRKLKLYHAVPVVLRADGLTAEVDGQGRRSLKGGMIKALSAARIGGHEDAPAALIDLWFDDPNGPSAALRGMRFDLDRFDPVSLLKDSEADGGPFETLMERLRSLSEAPVVPDPEGRLDGPWPLWPTVDEYEREIASLGG